MPKAPNRNRWAGWVSVAWLIAICACVVSVGLIFAAGFVEIPKRNIVGNVEKVREPNFFIWAIAVGQSVSAVMLAALFSMINSIYQNSCDLIAPQVDGLSELDGAPQQKDRPGFEIESVPGHSPLYQVLQPGYRLVSVNDKPVEKAEDADAFAEVGRNFIEFYNENSRLISRKINLKKKRFFLESPSD